MKRSTYQESFKLMIMDLYKGGQSMSSLSSEYSINLNMLYRWRREYLNPKRPSFTGRGNAALTDEQKELKHLKEKLKDVTMERDILKKAVSIFSKKDRTGTL